MKIFRNLMPRYGWLMMKIDGRRILLAVTDDVLDSCESFRSELGEYIETGAQNLFAGIRIMKKYLKKLLGKDKAKQLLRRCGDNLFELSELMQFVVLEISGLVEKKGDRR